MTSKVFSATFIGLEGKLVEVEVGILPGLHALSIVGLPDNAVKEAKERVALAIKNSGAQPPPKFNKKIVVNLAPADIKKEGSHFDLAIAIAFLLATDQIKQPKEKMLLLGELGLDGTLRKTAGILPASLLAKSLKFEEIIVPFENVLEAGVVEGIHAIGAKTLKEVILHLEKISPIKPTRSEINISQNEPERIFGYIQGQEQAKRALEIVAAGSHNLLMQGPPGAGKTLLAQAALELMPPMETDEILEVSKIYSICGLLTHKDYLAVARPFRAPHHTSSEAAIIGGALQPGEITKAHRGILFLDEFPEFHRDIIESLRQPLEKGEITISRAKGSARFPARFTLIAAMNPCPCGFFGDPKKECRCTAYEIRRYHKKVSGPLLDRIDLQLQILRPPTRKLFEEEKSQTTEIKERVKNAREKQLRRFALLSDKTKIFSNSEITFKHLKQLCALDSETERFAKNSIENLSLSPRVFHRLLRVARTIADLENEENIRLTHFAEALQYREVNLENI